MDSDAGDLLWPDGDRAAGSERLTCLKCGTPIPDGSLALTRRSIQDQPA